MYDHGSIPRPSRPRIHSHSFLRLHFSTIAMQMTTWETLGVRDLDSEVGSWNQRLHDPTSQRSRCVSYLHTHFASLKFDRVRVPLDIQVYHFVRRMWIVAIHDTYGSTLTKMTGSVFTFELYQWFLSVAPASI